MESLEPMSDKGVDMDFVMHVTISAEMIPDYDVDMATRLLRDLIFNNEDYRGKVVIRPLSEIIAC